MTFSSLEEQLARVLCDVIRIERIQPADDLFDFGIHSLLIAQVITRLRSELGVEVTMREVFDASRFDDFIRMVDRKLGTVPVPNPA